MRATPFRNEEESGKVAFFCMGVSKMHIFWYMCLENANFRIRWSQMSFFVLWVLENAIFGMEISKMPICGMKSQKFHFCMGVSILHFLVWGS